VGLVWDEVGCAGGLVESGAGFDIGAVDLMLGVAVGPKPVP